MVSDEGLMEDGRSTCGKKEHMSRQEAIKNTG
jgi:hypothetical protein